MKRLLILASALCVVLLSPLAQAAKVTRGPYLQMGSDTSMTIVWRTDEPTTAKVEYGQREGTLDQRAEAAAPATQHEIRITGLTPATRYYYAVGTTDTRLGGGDARHFFVTSPPSGARTKFRAWVVGDSGNGLPSQAAVRDAMVRDVGDDVPDIYLHLGDMAYTTGTDEQFQMNFFDMYQPILRHTVIWPTIGNHETKTSNATKQEGPYFDAYALPKNGESGGKPSGTEAYYSFDHGHVHFIVLDSDTPAAHAEGSEMLAWLADDLAATNQEWIIAFMHHPPYSWGSHNSDTSSGQIALRERVLPILESAGVDLVLAGHSHMYERSFLLDQAYDTPSVAGRGVLDDGDGRPLGNGPYTKTNEPHKGTVYVVAGHGGAPLDAYKLHPLMYMAEQKHGSALLDIDGDRLTFTNITSDGERSDTFTLMKAPGLVLASPNGGEKLKAGAKHDIRWATNGEHSKVHLDLSADGGKTWKPIADNVDNSGAFDWTVPGEATEAALVRIRDASNPDIADTSDASFVIYTGDAPPVRPNRPPEIVEMDTFEGPAGIMVTQQVRGSDPDGDPIAWSVEEMPSGASLTGTYFFWVPSHLQAGVWPIVFVADDGRGGIAKTTWTVRLADEDGVVPEPEQEPETKPATKKGCGGCSGTGSLGGLALLGLLFARRRS